MRSQLAQGEWVVIRSQTDDRDLSLTMAVSLSETPILSLVDRFLSLLKPRVTGLCVNDRAGYRDLPVTLSLCDYKSLYIGFYYLVILASFYTLVAQRCKRGQIRLSEVFAIISDRCQVASLFPSFVRSSPLSLLNRISDRVTGKASRFDKTLASRFNSNLIDSSRTTSKPSCVSSLFSPTTNLRQALVQ